MGLRSWIRPRRRSGRRRGRAVAACDDSVRAARLEREVHAAQAEGGSAASTRACASGGASSNMNPPPPVPVILPPHAPAPRAAL